MFWDPWYGLFCIMLRFQASTSMEARWLPCCDGRDGTCQSACLVSSDL